MIPLHTGFSKATVTLPRRDPSGQKRGEITAEVLQSGSWSRARCIFLILLQPGIYLLKVHGALDIFTFSRPGFAQAFAHLARRDGKSLKSFGRLTRSYITFCPEPRRTRQDDE